ncbi:hypothetical protein [Streptomyces decoyicus]|uniref:hypothetical protein n=1 Tax=Streptomyces decoyicus TaxID=249567 RepID=UPI0033B48524
MKREIVSKQYQHKGGFARVEQDNGGHLLVHCSGCRIEDYAAGMAPALAKLVAHVEK